MATVLIIEANQYITTDLMTHLSLQGLEVMVAHKGEEGVALAKKAKPGLIILDANLPDATGFQICNQLRQAKETQEIPIVMMSALAQYPNQQKFALERGVQEFIPKPVKVVELGEIVDKYVGPTPRKSQDVTAKSKYSVSTDVHASLSSWLNKGLTRKD